MRAFVDIVIETQNKTAAMGRLHSLGLDKGDGVRLFTNWVESKDGLFYLMFRVWEDRVHVIPEHNNPNFTILWRSDDLDEEGQRKPLPTYTWVDTELIEHTCTVPRIA